jgi:hypothetical protein
VTAPVGGILKGRHLNASPSPPGDSSILVVSRRRWPGNVVAAAGASPGQNPGIPRALESPVVLLSLCRLSELFSLLALPPAPLANHAGLGQRVPDRDRAHPKHLGNLVDRHPLLIQLPNLGIAGNCALIRHFNFALQFGHLPGKSAYGYFRAIISPDQASSQSHAKWY